MRGTSEGTISCSRAGHSSARWRAAFSPSRSALRAQRPATVPRIAYLFSGSDAATRNFHEAFRQGLRELGWVEGQNIVIEYRFAEGRFDRLPGLAAELVRLKVDVVTAKALGLTIPQSLLHRADEIIQ